MDIFLPRQLRLQNWLIKLMLKSLQLFFLVWLVVESNFEQYSIERKEKNLQTFPSLLIFMSDFSLECHVSYVGIALYSTADLPINRAKSYYIAENVCS